MGATTSQANYQNMLQGSASLPISCSFALLIRRSSQPERRIRY
jgi:hypothetical protein